MQTGTTGGAAAPAGGATAGGAAGGGFASLKAQSNELYTEIMGANIKFEKDTAPTKAAKNKSGSVSG
ncbi:hypothetical protein F9L33_09465 [Amylibacter sp. SFDW26]|uniref:hypothetical protein n=1 Tax=Amylibacter sp. SFDW26 TaxID=2652722 RepID=UPI0012617910|nr:hypothetical protein [Amylibacter sp. SFDW26]KAB7613598.1 hypothetical protein F9L33_09465 [Amylibacter sp. SFDW26]